MVSVQASHHLDFYPSDHQHHTCCFARCSPFLARVTIACASVSAASSFWMPSCPPDTSMALLYSFKCYCAAVCYLPGPPSTSIACREGFPCWARHPTLTGWLKPLRADLDAEHAGEVLTRAESELFDLRAPGAHTGCLQAGR